jgi:hypothetical protein
MFPALVALLAGRVADINPPPRPSAQVSGPPLTVGPHNRQSRQQLAHRPQELPDKNTVYHLEAVPKAQQLTLV